MERGNFVSEGPKPSVPWASPGTSDPPTLWEGNRELELGVLGPDPVACHHLVRIINT